MLWLIPVGLVVAAALAVVWQFRDVERPEVTVPSQASDESDDDLEWHRKAA